MLCYRGSSFPPFPPPPLPFLWLLTSIWPELEVIGACADSALPLWGKRQRTNSGTTQVSGTGAGRRVGIGIQPACLASRTGLGMGTLPSIPRFGKRDPNRNPVSKSRRKDLSLSGQHKVCEIIWRSLWTRGKFKPKQAFKVWVFCFPPYPGSCR